MKPPPRKTRGCTLKTKNGMGFQVLNSMNFLGVDFQGAVRLRVNFRRVFNWKVGSTNLGRKGFHTLGSHGIGLLPINEWLIHVHLFFV